MPIPFVLSVVDVLISYQIFRAIMNKTMIIAANSSGNAWKFASINLNVSMNFLLIEKHDDYNWQRIKLTSLSISS